MAKLLGKPDRQEHNHHRWIRMAIGGKYGAAGDIKSADSMDLTLRIDDALGGTFRHARCAGWMGWIIEFCRLALYVLALSPFEEIEIGEGRISRSCGIIGVFVRDITDFPPVRLVHVNPVSEEAMANMWLISWLELVA